MARRLKSGHHGRHRFQHAGFAGVIGMIGRKRGHVVQNKHVEPWHHGYLPDGPTALASDSYRSMAAARIRLTNSA